jgi:hypothetical protein
VRLFDGFTNLVARLGTSRDKAAAGGWTAGILDVATLDGIYRTSAVARKIVDLPAEDAGREWREWQAEAEQISAIEAEESRLNLPAAIIRAKKAARLYGGSAIYIGADNAEPSLPLNVRAVRRGGLRYVTVLAAHHLSEGPSQNDPRLPGFGLPTHYTMHSGDAVSVRIHPSRLVILKGQEVPVGAMSVTGSWGDSVLQTTIEAARNLDGTAANIASLVYEAKVDVFRIKGFNEGMRAGGPEYEKYILARWALVAQAKGNNGAILLDKDEEYEQKSASFGSLSDILDRFMILTSAAGSIPVTRLFGRSAAGLNATGESDIRDYYDRVRTMQSLEIGPAMSVLDECLIRSALDDRPPGVHYNWRPLWSPSLKERAEVGKVQAETLKIVSELGAVSDEALGKTAVNALTESGAFPGLEAAANEFPVLDPDDVELGLPGNLNLEEGDDQ